VRTQWEKGKVSNSNNNVIYWGWYIDKTREREGRPERKSLILSYLFP
jgi:hypothetical protein